MANSFMEAYGYPTAYWFVPGESVHWDPFKDWMLVKQSQTQRTARGRVEDFRFVGELVIVRQSWEAAEQTLAFLLDIVQAHVDWLGKQYNPTHARIVLVLEGWERPIVVGRVDRRVAWSVQPLPPVPSS